MTKEELLKLRTEAEVMRMGDFRGIANIFVKILDHLIAEAEKPKERWRAGVGEKYWFVDSDGEVTLNHDNRDVDDNAHFDCGNYCSTQDEAKAAAERVRKAYGG